MNTKKSIIFSLVCILALAGVFCVGYYIEQKNTAYKNLYLEFKTPEENYEIKPLDPITFIKDTNALDISFPKIEPQEIGEHTYVYVAHDSWGNDKEYILSLNFVDPVKPILILSTPSVSITEGDSIDLKSYVVEAYDPVDGNLEIEIEEPKELSVGEHEIVYTITDKHKNVVTAKLKLIINAKSVEPEPVPKQPDDSDSSKQSSSKPDTNNSGNSKPGTGSNSNNSSSNGSSGNQSSKPAALPGSKTFTIAEYGSIAAADRAAKNYGSSNCPSGHTWSSNPFSENGIIVGYRVTFD